MPFKGPARVIRVVGSSDSVLYEVETPDGKKTNLHHNRLKPVLERGEDRVEDERPLPMSDHENGGGGGKYQDITGKDPSDINRAGRPIIPPWLFGTSETTPRDPYVTRYGREVRPLQVYQA